MPRRALITGITGQDGSYLAEFLLSKGYEVPTNFFELFKGVPLPHSQLPLLNGSVREVLSNRYPYRDPSPTIVNHVPKTPLYMG
jgi:hypothetical protein